MRNRQRRSYRIQLENRNLTRWTNGHRWDDRNDPYTKNPSNRNLEPGAIISPRSILTTRSHFGSGKDLDPRSNLSSNLESPRRKTGH
ncbi:hypothetical protein DY000_02016543 [Brassica cretica]|uniref:Uncharacterized protein n=1 Tax=Brassica cretica TaxID=69181 RepID=A0ABQ7CV80_BRACR|nr:hypothetical protein DY000_02016543 [Brassica cretica]